MTSVDPRVEKSLREIHDGLEQRGELLSPERMQAGYAAFRSRFGPDALKSLDGPALLNTMHAHGNKESLVYWLEFKNDDEFPGQDFGSIAGGSAHKFGLFRRKETNQWVTGSPTHDKNISEADAITIARKHRDQLLLGKRQTSADWPGHTSTGAYCFPRSLTISMSSDFSGTTFCECSKSHLHTKVSTFALADSCDSPRVWAGGGII
jgi:5-methylcytosine-specific restriction enzyme B